MKRQKSAGFIFCKKLNKKIIISQDARPHPIYGFICKCGVWVNDFTFGHDLVWNNRLDKEKLK